MYWFQLIYVKQLFRSLSSIFSLQVLFSFFVCMSIIPKSFYWFHFISIEDTEAIVCLYSGVTGAWWSIQADNADIHFLSANSLLPVVYFLVSAGILWIRYDSSLVLVKRVFAFAFLYLKWAIFFLSSIYALFGSSLSIRVFCLLFLDLFLGSVFLNCLWLLW